MDPARPQLGTTDTGQCTIWCTGVAMISRGLRLIQFVWETSTGWNLAMGSDQINPTAWGGEPTPLLYYTQYTRYDNRWTRRYKSWVTHVHICVMVYFPTPYQRQTSLFDGFQPNTYMCYEYYVRNLWTQPDHNSVQRAPYNVLYDVQR